MPTNNSLDTNAAFYFVLKPFKLAITIILLLMTLMSLSLFSLLYFSNIEGLNELSKQYSQLTLTNSNWHLQIASICYQWLYAIFFKATGVVYLLQNRVEANTLLAGYQRYLFSHRQELMILISALKLVSIRLGILIIFMSTILLALIVIAVVDGWAERAIRRECLGRESASMYHQSKFIRSAVLMLFLIIYFSWPWYLDPMWLLAGGSLIAILIRTQAKFYKKYI